MDGNRELDTLPVQPGTYEIWHQWQRVEHGEGCLASLPGELRRLGITRPLLVTTRSLVRQGALLDSVRNAMGMPAIAEFAEAQPHTPREVVLAAAAAARKGDPDGIVSFGGSTVIDTGKGVALALAGGVRSSSEFDRYRQAGQSPSPFASVLPHVALPTTLSGAEYSRDIGMTNEVLRKKEIFRFDSFAPRSVLLDPILTTATPQRLWAATGVKVMSDATEQLYGRASHPVVDALCVSAIRWFFKYLPLSEHADPKVRIDARMRCQIASWKTLFGIHNAGTRVGIGGALRYQLGGMFRIPHGEATCVMLPHVIRFNFPAVPDRYRRLAEAMEIPLTADDAERLERIVADVSKLIAALNLPDRLEPLGVRRQDIPVMAARVMHEASLAFNPRKVRDEGEVIALLEAAL